MLTDPIILFPGLDVRVVLNEHTGARPWLGVSMGKVTATPDVTRETPDALRALATQIEDAWARVDRRALREANGGAPVASSPTAPRIDLEA